MIRHQQALKFGVGLLISIKCHNDARKLLKTNSQTASHFRCEMGNPSTTTIGWILFTSFLDYDPVHADRGFSFCWNFSKIHFQVIPLPFLVYPQALLLYLAPWNILPSARTVLSMLTIISIIVTATIPVVQSAVIITALLPMLLRRSSASSLIRGSRSRCIVLQRPLLQWTSLVRLKDRAVMSTENPVCPYSELVRDRNERKRVCIEAWGSSCSYTFEFTCKQIVTLNPNRTALHLNIQHQSQVR
jgi:hypothetical protein